MTKLLEQFIPKAVTHEEKTKYARVIANWTYLSTYMCMNDPGIDTIGLLVRIELNGRKRKDILDRLVARLTSCVRQQLKQEMRELYEREDD